LDILEVLNNVDGVVYVLRDIRKNIENEFKIIYIDEDKIDFRL